MAKFHASKRVRLPEDIIPFLAKGERHWRKGYSAYELAHSWMGADDFPERVRRALDTVPEFRGAEVLQACFERETGLRTRGRDSQTDLLVYAKAGALRFVIAVEGKVNEPFGDLVSVWNTGSPTRVARLDSLCRVLGLRAEETGHLRYQLLHRTAAAIYEARMFACSTAIMLVHSFSTEKRWLEDFAAFSAALGTGREIEDRLSHAIALGDVDLRLGWVSDTPR